MELTLPHIILTVFFAALALFFWLKKHRLQKRMKHKMERMINERTVELKHYTKQLEKHQVQLEMLVEDRVKEIHSLNEELTASNEELSNMNTKLENTVAQRTAQIHDQNEKLIEYAFITSHRLRAPLARILGLIQLLQLHETKDMETIMYFNELLLKESEELDCIVKEMNRKLEDDETL